MRLHAFVSGRVQMVGFRYSTQRMATKLNLKGWVLNTRDGRVEVVADGSKLDITEFLKWLHEGPRHARVDDVQYDITEAKPEFESFSIKM